MGEGLGMTTNVRMRCIWKK